MLGIYGRFAAEGDSAAAAVSRVVPSLPGRLRLLPLLLCFTGLLAPVLQAGTNVTLTAPANISLCDTLVLTNRIASGSDALAHLIVTNTLPSPGYTYIPGQTVVTLPSGTVTSNAADPVSIVGGTNLVWDLRSVASDSSVSHLLITELFYNSANTTPSIDVYQWIELFNPTPAPITCVNWSLRDAVPGKVNALPSMTIAPGEFVIVAASNDYFRTVYPSYTGQLFQVSSGKLGSGLNLFGDGISLLDGSSSVVDSVSYGSAAVAPVVHTVVAGHSLARDPANQDSDTAADWADQTTPDPGSGTIPTGLQAGNAVQIVYKVAVACGAVGAQFFSRAGFEQPPGTPDSAQASVYVTVNPGALTITESPLSQSAGVGDLVAWTMTINNTGYGDARHAVVTETLGAGLNFVSFGQTPASTNATSTNTVAVWDETVVSALTNLPPGASVSLVVTARVVSCADLYSKVDARWGCTTNAVCQDSVPEGLTVVAGIDLLDRSPKIDASLPSAGTIPVSYCAGTNLVLTVANGVGPMVCTAYNMVISNTIPDGWTLTGAAVDTNGLIHVGDLPPGGVTNIAVTLRPGGTCPLSTAVQPFFFEFSYQDPCGHPYTLPVVRGLAQATAFPGASIVKVVPQYVSGSDGSFPVTIFLTYSNFVGTERIDISDFYPVSTNLTPTNISGAAVLTNNAVVWSGFALTGSGVYTQRFDMAIGTPCGGPVGQIVNRLVASDFTDCQGCPRSVAGSGLTYGTYMTQGAGCTTPGGTGTCYFASAKTVSARLAEVCQPVTLTHTFTNFAGSLPDWTGLTFVSDVSGANGYLESTSTVVVTVNGSNVMPYVAVTYATNLTVDLSGLNASVFSNLATVSEGLTIQWQVGRVEAGQATDTSYLDVPACGRGMISAQWNVGGSVLSVDLRPIYQAEACGIVTGRIDLAALQSPGLVTGSNGTFAAYDVTVVLDLDADRDGNTIFVYQPGSTVFTNMMSGGSPTNGFDPVVTGTGTQLVWKIGDLDANGAGSILYRLRVGCTAPSAEKHAAHVYYNNRCERLSNPPQRSAGSATNSVPSVYPRGHLIADIQPSVTFLTDTQLVVRLHLMNTGGGSAYNVVGVMGIPTNVTYGGASVPATSVTSTTVVWTFQTGVSAGSLVDGDGDGAADDLPPGGELDIVVTNYVASCQTPSLTFYASHGCLGSPCQVTDQNTALFQPGMGSIVARTTLPISGDLCAPMPLILGIRNGSLATVYGAKAKQELPSGITYVPGSARVSVNGGATNAVADPTGSGASSDPLVWSDTQIPRLSRLLPNDDIAITYQVFVGSLVSSGGNPFLAYSGFTDACGASHQTTPSTSILTIKPPNLRLTTTAAKTVLDRGDANVYTITIAHGLDSVAVSSMRLQDTLPAGFTFTGASPAPDAIDGNVLVWSNATLMRLDPGDRLSPFAVTEGPISLTVSGIVTTCDGNLGNTAQLAYGCDDTLRFLTNTTVQTSRSTPSLESGAHGGMTLTPGGGTLIVTVTNYGATASGIVVTNVAPAGYVFKHASISGAFVGADVPLALSGSPVGSVAVVDLRTAGTSGATDSTDNAGDGLTNLDLGLGDGFALTFTLDGTGSRLDALADPTDYDYEDPEPPSTMPVSASSTVAFRSLCGGVGSLVVSASALPSQPNADIDIQPNNLFVADGQATTVTVTVVNNGEVGNASNLHVRVEFGSGWTNITFVTNTLVQSGSGSVTVEVAYVTNVLIELPGVVLNPLNDKATFTFTAQSRQGAGPLYILGEVVGDAGNTAITGYTPTNVLGRPPLADTMQGVALGPVVNGRYYSFDQDATYGVGYTLTKTVRFAGEPVEAGGAARTARIGEPLIYHLDALYFGATFSNVTVTEDFPTNLVFGTPTNYAFLGVTNAVYDAAAGVFTLQPAILTANPSRFSVDIPATVRNAGLNQDGVIATNTAVAQFDVAGVTNAPPTASATVSVVEPQLQVLKLSSVGTNTVQAGDIIIFTNVISHTALSSTTAYDVVFSDTLPAGLSFVIPGTTLDNDGLDNDGDGRVDAADTNGEGTIVGNTITVTSSNNPALVALGTGSTVVVTFKARVLNQVLGSRIDNTAGIVYQSLPDPTNEVRNGSDGVGTNLNNYAATSTVELVSRNVTAVNKTLFWSSQTNTVDPDLTIGERVVYKINVAIPRGVVTNLTITDLVPAGLDWVGSNPDPALHFPSEGYQFVIPADGPAIATNAAQGLQITDSDPTPASSTNADGSGVSPVFAFPAFTNADGVGGCDAFDFYLEFVVLDAAVNNGIGVSRTTASNGVIVANGGMSHTAYADPYKIAEAKPQLAKTVAPHNVDAGDIVTNTLVVTNRADASANAYDIVVVDVLTNTAYDLGSFANLVVPDGWTWSTSAISGGLQYQLASGSGVPLTPGQSVTNVFTLRIADTVSPGLAWTNIARITTSDCIDGTQPGGMPDRIYHWTNDTTESGLSVTNVTITKVLAGTSETNVTDSTGRNVQIGEVVTYGLTVVMPESTISNLTVVDLIPRGMQYVTNRVDASGFTGTLPLPPAVTGGPTNGGAVTLTFAGNTVVTANNVSGDNSIVVYVDAVVLDTNSNVGLPGSQTTHTNSARVTFAGGATNVSGIVVTTNVEPRIWLRKNFSTNRVDAGDTVTVNLVVSNNGTATAYDLLVTDRLDSVFFDASTVTNFYVNGMAPTGYVLSVTGTTVSIVSDAGQPPPLSSLETNEVITFSFDVKAAQTVTPGLAVTNVAAVTADTIWGLASQQRYLRAQGTNTLSVTNITISKVLAGTSETNTVDSTGQNVQIGEVVTYGLTVTMPESTITNLAVTDLIPWGMQYVTNRVDAGGFVGTLPQPPTVMGGTSNGGAVTLTFAGNTVVTSNNVSSDNSIVVYVDAVVLDTNSNIGLPGLQTTHTNSARVTFAGGPTNVSGIVVTTNVEPRIWLRKSFSTNRVDAGDAVTVSLVLSNNGTATAYDLLVTDRLDSVFFDASTVTNFYVNGMSPTGYVLSVTGSTVSIASDAGQPPPLSSLETNEVITFNFDVKVAQTVTPGLALTNLAVVTADTIWGAVAQQRYLRTQGTNTLSVTNITIAKVLAGTSETNAADSTGRNVQIGEVVTYGLTVTMPESTITNLAVTDLIPWGMRYVTNRVDASGFTGSLPVPLTVTGGATNGGAVTLTFAGNTVVAGNNLPTDNSVVVYVDAVVLDTNSNVGLPGQQTTHTNSARVTFAGGPTNVSGTVVTTNVEPRVGIAKRMSAPTNGVVLIDLTVTNNGTAAAYDVAVQDLLSSVYFQAGTAVSNLVPAGFLFRVVPGAGGDVVTFQSDPAQGQPANTVDPGETLNFRFQATLVPGTTGPVVNVATVISNTTIAGVSPYERLEPQAQDTNVLSLGTDLAVTKTVSVTNPPIGAVITYIVGITNLGAYGATGVRVTDVLPSAVTFSNATASQGSYAASNGEWTVGSLAIGSSATLQMTARINAGVAGLSITNVATLTGIDQPDTNAANNTARAVFRVPVADLSLQLLVDNPSAQACTCAGIFYTIVVSNAGPDTATGVAVQDQFLSTNVVYYASDNGAGAYTNGVWTIGTLAAHTQATLRLTAAIAGPGVASHSAEIMASDQYDPDSTPNNQVSGEDDMATAVTDINADSNHNGIPDWWEIQYFGGLLANVTLDPDGDGVNNLNEYACGTDPTHSNSCLRVMSTQRIGSNDVAVTVFLGSNRTYGILGAYSSAGPWTTLVSFSNGESGVQVWTDRLVVANATQRFYRITASCGALSYTNTVRPDYTVIVPTTLLSCTWSLMGVPVDITPPNNNLNSELGRQLAVGLTAARELTNCFDRVFVPNTDGTWKECLLVILPDGSTNWWDVAADTNANVVIAPASSFWVKRCSPTAPPVKTAWTGLSYTNAPAIFLTNGWTMFSWPLGTPGSHHNLGAATPVDQLGFLAAGAKGGKTGTSGMADGDELWIWSGTRWAQYWLVGMGNTNYDGRWWDGAKNQFGEFSLETGKGYFYRHRGTNGFLWTPHEASTP